MNQDLSGDSKEYPLLPLKELIIFPHMVVPLFVGREKSITALEASVKNGNELFMVAQKDASILSPEREDVYEIGTIVNVIQMLRLPDNTVKVLIEGRQRARMTSFRSDDRGIWAQIEECPSSVTRSVELEAATRGIKNTFEQYVKLNKKIPPELLMSISSIDDPSRLADIIVAHITMKLDEKQEILEAINVEDRLKLLMEKMQGEIEIINVEKKIRSNVKTQMEKSQKEYYLNEQMNAIQKELGQKDDAKGDILEMTEKLAKKDMPEEARDKVEKEIKKLKMMSPMSAESAVVRNYVEWMLALPWNEVTEEDHDINQAQIVLENDHYGLRDVKDRIIEYLSVRTLLKDPGRGTILCLVGPPGVGKTSVAKSLAEAAGRSFVRISLGGIRDESEIRGHRRTYVGAMPGKIISALKRAKKSNPLILLDEIDKMSSDMRGDPASAMLELLDPEQNKNFVDHYIEVEYDMSKVMFIMTANDINGIPGPLKDRMEIITVPGYTPYEKLQIAKNFLLKKAIKNNGMDDYPIRINDKTFMSIITNYTRESGVRSLERKINTVIRKIAAGVVTKKIPIGKKYSVSTTQLKDYLGPAVFDRTDIETEPQVGLVNGLAYTPVGGEVLHIEVITVSGNGKLQITGKLGEVMQESAKAALSYVRAISDRLKIGPEWYDKHDIHIHVPEGATPKDGPSAGIALATALTSAITGIKVRQDIAMTGEVTIRGRVLPIGGLKEKLLGAKQSGIHKVIIPKKNEKDLLEVPDEIMSGMEILPVSTCEDVLKQVLEIADPAEFMKVVGLSVVQDTPEESIKVAN